MDDDIFGVGIGDDVSGVVGILDITVRGIGSKAFTALGFALKRGSDLVTGGLGVPFVEDMPQFMYVYSAFGNLSKIICPHLWRLLCFLQLLQCNRLFGIMFKNFEAEVHHE